MPNSSPLRAGPNRAEVEDLKGRRGRVAFPMTAILKPILDREMRQAMLWN
jgi:hypothetical protein